MQTGPGTTRLLGASRIGGIALDGGRTVQNDGALTWSSGDIVLGGGDAAVSAHAGTLSNAGVLRITADGVIGPQAGGTGMLHNTGVIAVAGRLTDKVNVDATLVNQGIIQVTSGTLSLNGGGSSSGPLMISDWSALCFGAPVHGGAGGAFSIVGGYAVGHTVVDGGTLDLSAADHVQFVNTLWLTGGGSLLLDGVAATAAQFAQDNAAVLSGSDTLRVTDIASLGDGVQTGVGTTVLLGQSSIEGTVQLDGGRTLENDGTLVWNRGSIALGSGDANASVQAGWLNNAAGGVLRIAGDGTVALAGGGGMLNAGTLIKSGGIGNALIEAELNNSGTVLVQSGTLTLDQAVSGAGGFEIDGTAKLDFGSVVSSGEAIRFLGGGGTLAVERTGVFGATVSGFAAGDALDLTALDFAASPTIGFIGGTGGGALTVGDGAHSVMIALLGDYTPSGFQLAGDGHGGVLVQQSSV